ncbi:uncharacterized protein LOC102807303 [Saccoglossus kowalevskii]|uniref:Uncharacterized protein LOC102807303 n=1 Tax=Saccoglossus kowalevskii TaxID=10224 RepID=A0ABM0MWH9_SACKO|nr:PREDICTED: uncharacterized protein LOC102807303 [Saccoglossus kowalevskii]
MTTDDKVLIMYKAEIHKKYSRLVEGLNACVTQWETFCRQQNFFVSTLKSPSRLSKDTYIHSTANSALVRKLRVGRHDVKSLSDVRVVYIDYIKNPLTTVKAEILARFFVIIDRLREYRDELNETVSEILKRVDVSDNCQERVNLAHALNIKLLRLETLLKDDNDFSSLNRERHKLAIGDMLDFSGVISLAPTIHETIRVILKILRQYTRSLGHESEGDGSIAPSMSNPSKLSDRKKTVSLPPLVHCPPASVDDHHDQVHQYKDAESDNELDNATLKKFKKKADHSEDLDNQNGYHSNMAVNGTERKIPNIETQTMKMATTIRRGTSGRNKNKVAKTHEVSLPPIHENGVLGNSQDSHSAGSRRSDVKPAVKKGESLVMTDQSSDIGNSISSMKSAPAKSIQASVIQDLQRRVKSLEDSSADMKIRQKLHILLTQGLSPTVSPEVIRITKDHIATDMLMVFGLAIGLNIADIATLRETHHQNIKEMASQMLSLWQRQQGKHGATLEKFIESLIQIGERDVASACLDDLRLLVYRLNDTNNRH